MPDRRTYGAGMMGDTPVLAALPNNRCHFMNLNAASVVVLINGDRWLSRVIRPIALPVRHLPHGLFRLPCYSIAHCV